MSQIIRPVGYGVKAMRPPMPWPTVGKFDDTELMAIYNYIRSQQGR